MVGRRFLGVGGWERGGRASLLEDPQHVADAQGHLAQYLDENPVAVEEWTLKHKLNHDPRITKLGYFLRRSSLDEPPQFLNVLRGERSCVGLRPVEPGELQRYGMSAVIYQSLRPGVTRKWQVSGRSNVAYGKRVVLGVPYPEKMTWRGDIVILFKTLTPVAARTGR